MKRLWRTTNLLANRRSQKGAVRSGVSQKEACQTVRGTIHSNDCSFTARPQGLSPSRRVVFVLHSSFVPVVYIHFPSHSAGFVASSFFSSQPTEIGSTCLPLPPQFFPLTPSLWCFSTRPVAFIPFPRGFLDY